MLIDHFVNSIYLFNDKVLLDCNYTDGTKTITFDEATKAVTEATASATATGSDMELYGAPKALKRLGFRAFSFWILPPLWSMG